MDSATQQLVGQVQTAKQQGLQVIRLLDEIVLTLQRRLAAGSNPRSIPRARAANQNLEILKLQAAVQEANRQFNSLGNALKAARDSGSIDNFR